jgi:hypothetical protein
MGISSGIVSTIELPSDGCKSSSFKFSKKLLLY